MSESPVEETSKEEVQEIELDGQAVDAIADTVLDKMSPKLEGLFKSFEDRLAAAEPTVSKNVNGGASDDQSFTAITGGTDIEKMSKERRFVKHIQASLRGDHGAFKAYQEYALEAREKAGYNNEGISADGGVLILQPDFEADIERLLPQVGGLVSEVNFVPLNSNSVITNKGTNDVSFTKTLEGAAKPASKSAFSQQTVSLNKYSAILLATTELIEDQATDFWADARDQYAYAYGKKIDEMVLTDNGTTSSEKGLLHTSGVTLEPTSGAGSTVTWDDLLNVKYAVPGEAATNGIFVMHRSTYNTLRQLKGNSNDYLTMGSFVTNQPQTPWGDRIVLTDVMPIAGSSWVGTTVGAGVVYGDFKRYAKVYTKSGGLQLSVSDTATVVDQASATQNLWQNNMIGMRAEFRATFFAKFPEAFGIIGQTPLS